MTQIVRARIGDREVTVSEDYAKAKNLEILDAPTHREDGRAIPETRRGGRPLKPSVDLKDLTLEGSGTQASYDTWKKAALLEEIDKRNADRAEEDQVVVAAKAKNADLAAALAADDEALAQALAADGPVDEIPDHETPDADQASGQQTAEGASAPNTALEGDAS